VNIGFDQCRNDVLECLLSKSFTPSERSAWPWSTQLVAAINHLHSCDVVHLDLKLENMLIDHYGRLKVCDLGLAALLPPGGRTGKLCGSGVYAAPEVLLTRTMGHYDGRAADIWSMGICIFILSLGRFPFKAKHATQLYMSFLEEKATAIRTGKAQLPPPIVLCSQSQRGSFSPSLCTLLDSCLALDPATRPSANVLAHHPWLRDEELAQSANEQAASQDVKAMARELVHVVENGYTTPHVSPIIEPRSIATSNVSKTILKQRRNPQSSTGQSASHGFRRAGHGNRPTPFFQQAGFQAHHPTGEAWVQPGSAKV
jgi:serine/threonine protein kinase